MSYRLRMISTVKYGQFGAYFATLKRLVEINDARGWAPMRVLVPTVGTNNEVVFEIEYPDLATLQREIFFLIIHQPPRSTRRRSARRGRPDSPPAARPPYRCA